MDNDILGKIIVRQLQVEQEVAGMEEMIQDLKSELIGEEKLELEWVFLKWRVRQQQRLIEEIKEDVHLYVLEVDPSNKGLKDYPF